MESPKQSSLPVLLGPPRPRQAASGRACRAVPEPWQLLPTLLGALQNEPWDGAAMGPGVPRVSSPSIPHPCAPRSLMLILGWCSTGQGGTNTGSLARAGRRPGPRGAHGDQAHPSPSAGFLGGGPAPGAPLLHPLEGGCRGCHAPCSWRAPAQGACWPLVCSWGFAPRMHHGAGKRG